MEKYWGGGLGKFLNLFMTSKCSSWVSHKEKKPKPRPWLNLPLVGSPLGLLALATHKRLGNERVSRPQAGR